uniref:Uncharacterized protein n=1 Tax=Trichogramma kaykai TaxID=54128 RepID=A0ABD2WHJ3_9HYME
MNQDPGMILASYVYKCDVALYASTVANPRTRTSRISRTSFIARTRNALGYSRTRICSRAQNRTNLSCVHGVVSSAARCSYGYSGSGEKPRSSKFFVCHNSPLIPSSCFDKNIGARPCLPNNISPWLERRRRKTGKIEELITSLIIILDKTLVHAVNSTVLKNVNAQSRAILILHRCAFMHNIF